MSSADPQVSPQGDAGIKKIFLLCDGHEPVGFKLHPRWFFSPIHLCNQIETVRLRIETNNPAAKISLNGFELVSGRESEPIRLVCGKNNFSGTVVSADGIAKINFNCKIFRAYPHLSWEKVSDKAPWLPRDSAGELVFKNRMWILGGYIPSFSNDVWSSPDGKTWTKEADIPTRKGFDLPVAFVFKDRMWIADVDGVLFSSPDGKAWDVVSDKAPWAGRSSAGAVVFNGKIWIMGGLKDGELFNDVWSSSDGINWNLELAQAPWSKRQIHNTPVVLDGKMWLLGGGIFAIDYYPFVAWNDVWCSPDGVNWEQVLEHAPWESRIWGSSAVFLDRLWVIGGFRSEPAWKNFGDVWYSSNGRDWRELVTPPQIQHSGYKEAFTFPAVWEPRHEQSVYAHDGAIWVVGGMIWPLMNDVWKLDISGLCFTSQPVIEVYSHTPYEYRAHADFNRSRRQVRYRIGKGPSWLRLDGCTGVLRGTAQAPGMHEVILEAFDESGETARQAYSLHVLKCSC